MSGRVRAGIGIVLATCLLGAFFLAFRLDVHPVPLFPINIYTSDPLQRLHPVMEEIEQLSGPFHNCL
jgi:hypothetical protein